MSKPTTTHDTTASRGHVEEQLGRKLCVCIACKAKKPKRGGWQSACPADKRVFMGGEPA